MRNDAFCGIMPEIAAEQKGSRNPEAPADIVILFVLMKFSIPIYWGVSIVMLIVAVFLGVVPLH